VVFQRCNKTIRQKRCEKGRPDCRRAALQELKAKGRACMLLTNTLKNTAIYGNYGFRVIKELQHDFEGLYSYFMLVQPEQMKGCGTAA